MLSFDDARWEQLKAGYRIPIDLRPLLQRLEATNDPDPVWDELWQELHHQGNVGEGSFIAVPHLVRIHRARGLVDWNTYALAATIELARATGGNPDVPDWARESYERALRDLAWQGLAELPIASDREAVRSILGLLAVAFGARVHGRFLTVFSEDEVLELESTAFGNSVAGGGRTFADTSHLEDPAGSVEMVDPGPVSSGRQADLEAFAAENLAVLGAEPSALHALIEAEHAIVPILVRAFRCERDAEKRASILHIIWQHRQPSAALILAEALRDPADVVWKEAFDGLVGLDLPTCIPAIESARGRRLEDEEDAIEFSEYLEEAIDQLRHGVFGEKHGTDKDDS